MALFLRNLAQFPLLACPETYAWWSKVYWVVVSTSWQKIKTRSSKWPKASYASARNEILNVIHNTIDYKNYTDIFSLSAESKYTSSLDRCKILWFRSFQNKTAVPSTITTTITDPKITSRGTPNQCYALTFVFYLEKHLHKCQNFSVVKEETMVHKQQRIPSPSVHAR